MDQLDPEDPSHLGDFRLLRRLGQGGMGVVYLAVGPAGEAVAVKAVHLHLARNVEFRHRFAREVRSARRVTGSGLAEVLEVGPESGVPWMATEYIPGLTLSKLIPECGSLPLSSLAALGVGLAETLTAVHASGMAHRDLKPSNVIAGSHGPRLIDLGIARAHDDTVITRAGQAVGTPGYMAPEFVEKGYADERSDLFSYGSVMAYAATGRHPFGGGPPMAIVRRSANEEPRLDGVPTKLLSLLRGCLSKDPLARPQLSVVIAELCRLGAPEPVAWLPAPMLAAIDQLTAQAMSVVKSAAQAPPTVLDPSVREGADASGTNAGGAGADGAGAGVVPQDETVLAPEAQRRRDELREAKTIVLPHPPSEDSGQSVAPLPAGGVETAPRSGGILSSLLPRIRASVLAASRPSPAPRVPSNQIGSRPLVTDAERLEFVQRRVAAVDAPGPEERLAQLRQLVPEMERAMGEDHKETLYAGTWLAYAVGETGAPEKAVRQYKQLLPAIERAFGPEHSETLITWRSMAYFAGEAGQHDEAVEVLTEKIPLMTSALGYDQEVTLTARRHLVWNLGLIGEHATAAALGQELVRTMAETCDSDNEQLVYAKRDLAYSAGLSGDVATAVEALNEILPVLIRLRGFSHPDAQHARELLNSYVKT